jgi:hypothetical protein
MTPDGDRGRPRVSMALVHYPVRARDGEATATAVIPLSVHDLARVARTYDLGAFYVVTPLRSQQALMRRVAHHWEEGYGATYNPTRREALTVVRLAESLNDVVRDLAEREGRIPRMVATGAAGYGKNVTFGVLRRDMWRGEESFLLLFGTSWGLDRGIIDECDLVLEPVRGLAGFNHLPVREAAAIILDRLLGDRGEDIVA